MGKKILTLLGVVVLVLGVAGGSFYGGMLYQQSQAAGAQARFFADRGGAPPGDVAGGTQGGNFPGGQGGTGSLAGQAAFGEIKSIDGDTLTLSTAQSEVKVTLTDATAIQKMVSGAPGDLQVGARITVRGERDASGNVTASNIQITASAEGQ
jgi:hypothetical protein